ncbi:MAG: hypothetical protein F6J98_15085 [Moorea sp. SIO4G2]|nr:hypothetical protein [Moorena sp. SIO4G2]
MFSANYTWAFGLDDLIPKVKVPKLPGGINEQIEDAINDTIDDAVDEIIPYGIPRSLEELVDLLFGALAKDYGVIQQTPYSAGYNEVLIVSPSTGAEQRMQVNLPEEEFRIYEIAFKGVSVPKPKAVVGGQSPLQESEIKDRLSEFTIKYDTQNKVQAIILADGTKAEFSNSQAIIYGASGKPIETITLSQANANPSENYIALKNIGKQKCESNVKQLLQATLDNANLKNLNLAQLGTSDEARLLAWAGTFGREALADSLLPDSRNQTIQSISCQAPVQCNVKHTYKGASEVRTDLFKIPPGTNPKVALEYEFYSIPDRLEIFYEGSRIFGVGPKSGRDTKRIGNLPDNAKYVGVKVIGNRDEGTRWWYTIHCSNTGVVVSEDTLLPNKFLGEWSGYLTRQKDKAKMYVTMTLANKSQAGEATGVFKLTSSECKSEFTVKTVTDSSIVLSKKEGNPECDLEDISLNLVSDNELMFAEDQQMYFAQGYRERSLYKENIPCENEPSFKLNDNLYLDNFDDPFVFPNKDNEERIARNDILKDDSFFTSKSDNDNLLEYRYHYYATFPNIYPSKYKDDIIQFNKICEIGDKGCTRKNVFAEMMSQARFTAPARPKQASNPVKNCMVVDLNVEGWKDNLGRFFFGTEDKVVVMVKPEDFMAINYTLPTHTLFPGRVVRQVIEKNGAVWVSTIGEGRGDFASINEKQGLKIFSEEIDRPFKEHVRNVIENDLPWGLEANRK